MSPAFEDYEESNRSVLEGLGVVPRQNITTAHSSQGASRFHRYPYNMHTQTADDVVVLFVIIASVIGVASGISLMFGLWQSRRQHRRLAKVVEMDSDDFFLYARVAQNEDRYVRIVQLTHPAKEQNPTRKPYKSVEKNPPTDENKLMYRPPDGNLPQSTSSAPAILSGLWRQRHLLTGRGDTLVDSFINLKKPAWQERVRASMSDTSHMIDRPSVQSFESICQECGSGSSSLAGGKFPRNISCRLCRQRAGIRDIQFSARTKNYSVAGQQDVSPAAQTQAVGSSITTQFHHSPGRPKLSTFPERRRKSCTAELRAQLDPFRTMVTLSSSSEDSTSDSD